MRMVIKSPKRENIGWDATSRDQKYLGHKIHGSVLTLGHTDQKGSESRVEMTRDVSFGDASSWHPGFVPSQKGHSVPEFIDWVNF